MFLTERITKGIASRIASTMGMNKDQEEVLAYGAFSILQILWSTFLVAVMGYLFGVLLEAMIISFTAALLRRFSGGAHATSPGRCNVIGVIIFIGLALAAKELLLYSNLPVYISLGVLSFIFTYWVVAKYCPVDHPNKPITDKETRARLKKGAIGFVHLLLVLCIVLWILYQYSNELLLLQSVISVYLGISCQAFALTPLGHLFINKLDSILGRITFKRGGEQSL